MIVTPDMVYYEACTTIEDGGALIEAADIITDDDQGRTGVKVTAYGDPRDIGCLFRSYAREGEVDLTFNSIGDADHVLLTPDEATHLAIRLLVKAQQARGGQS